MAGTTQARGYKDKLLIDFEPTFGVSPTIARAINMPFNTNEVVSQQPLQAPATITGTRNPVDPILGRLSVDGNIVIPVDGLAIGYWFYAMFGPATVTGTADPYTHVWKVGDTQPSMVIEKGFPDVGEYFLFNGCKIAKFDMTAGNDGELTATMTLMGAKETIAKTSYDPAPQDAGFYRINNINGTALIDGVIAANLVQTLQLTFDMGLDGNMYTIGSNNTRGDIPESIVNMSGKIGMLFKDADIIRKAAAFTNVILELKFEFATGHSLSFKIPKAYLSRTSPPVAGPAGVVYTLDLQASGVNSDKSATIVTLVNSVAKYEPRVTTTEEEF